MAEAIILERFLYERNATARIACPRKMIPATGQYLLAYNSASDDPLTIPVFSAGDFSEGFLAASPLPRTWSPGVTLSLRGPLGRGFALPVNARRIALAALDVTPAYLLGLIPKAQAQGAGIVLVCDDPPDDLPSDVEIRPLAALEEINQWADYLALAATREEWGERIRNSDQLIVTGEAQVLIVTPMPCGGLGQCGVCSVDVKRGEGLACEDGPVFNL